MNKCRGCGVVLYSKRSYCRRCEEEERAIWARQYENRYTDHPRRNWMASLLRDKGELR